MRCADGNAKNTALMAASIPLVMSRVVEALWEARTPRPGVDVAAARMSRMAASVLVPPTSTPIRYRDMLAVEKCAVGWEDDTLEVPESILRWGRRRREVSPDLYK